MHNTYRLYATRKLFTAVIVAVLVGTAAAATNIPVTSCQILQPNNTYSLDADIKTFSDICFQAAGPDIVLMGNGRTVLCAITDAWGEKCKHAFDGNGHPRLSVEHLNAVGFQQGIKLHEDCESLANIIINSKNALPLSDEERKNEEESKKPNESLRRRRRVLTEEERIEHSVFSFEAADTAFNSDPWAANNNNHEDFRYGYVASATELRSRHARQIPMKRAPHRGPNRIQRRAKVQQEEGQAQQAAQNDPFQPQQVVLENTLEPNKASDKKECDVAALLEASDARKVVLTLGEANTVSVTGSKLFITVSPQADDSISAGDSLIFYEFNAAKFFENSRDCTLEDTDHPLELVTANPTNHSPLIYLSGFLLVVVNSTGKVAAMQSTSIVNIMLQGVDANIALFRFDDEHKVWEAPQVDCDKVKVDAVESTFNKEEGSLSINTCQKGQFAIFSYEGFTNPSAKAAETKPQITSDVTSFTLYITIFVIAGLVAGAALLVVTRKRTQSTSLLYAPVSPDARNTKKRNNSKSPRQQPQNPLSTSQNVLNVAPSPLLSSNNKQQNNSNESNYANRALRNSGTIRASPKLASSPALPPAQRLRNSISLKKFSL